MTAPRIAHLKGPQFAHCPDCGSPDTHQTVLASQLHRTTYTCGDCGHAWAQTVPEPPEVWQ